MKLESTFDNKQIKGFYILDALIVEDAEYSLSGVDLKGYNDIHKIIGAMLFNLYTKDIKTVTIDVALKYLDYHDELTELLIDYGYVGFKTYWSVLNIYNTLGGKRVSSDKLCYNALIIDSSNKELGSVINNYGIEPVIEFRNVNSFLSVRYNKSTGEVLIIARDENLMHSAVYEDSTGKDVVLTKKMEYINTITSSMYIDKDIDIMFSFLFKRTNEFIKVGDCTYILVGRPRFCFNIPKDCRVLYLSLGSIRHLKYLTFEGNLEAVGVISGKNKLNNKEPKNKIGAFSGLTIINESNRVSNLNVVLNGDLDISDFKHIFRFMGCNLREHTSEGLADVLMLLGNYCNGIVVLGDILGLR